MKKPKIFIKGHAGKVGPYCTDYVNVFHGEKRLIQLVDDAIHKITDASTCCELLAKLEKEGIIELEADEFTKKTWGELLK